MVGNDTGGIWLQGLRVVWDGVTAGELLDEVPPRPRKTFWVFGISGWGYSQSLIHWS